MEKGPQVILGLLAEPTCLAAKALAAFGVRLGDVRERVEAIVGRGEARDAHLPLTPRAKEVLQLSLRESLALGQDFIGTGHILLGMVREGEGVASEILSGMHVPSEALRGTIVRELLRSRG